MEHTSQEASESYDEQYETRKVSSDTLGLEREVTEYWQPGYRKFMGRNRY